LSLRGTHAEQCGDGRRGDSSHYRRPTYDKALLPGETAGTTAGLGA
jgi:hypothetical protein